MIGRQKDWHRGATRYDRCLKVFLSSVALAATCSGRDDQSVGSPALSAMCHGFNSGSLKASESLLIPRPRLSKRRTSQTKEDKWTCPTFLGTTLLSPGPFLAQKEHH